MSYRGAKKSPDQYATSTNISDSGTPLMAVAIDRDKNSQHAVRWAVENLRFKEKKVILVHVCSKQSLRSRRYSFLCMHATNYNNVLSFIHNTQYLIKCCVYLAMCQYVHIIWQTKYVIQIYFRLDLEHYQYEKVYFSIVWYCCRGWWVPSTKSW